MGNTSVPLDQSGSLLHCEQVFAKVSTILRKLGRPAHTLDLARNELLALDEREVPLDLRNRCAVLMSAVDLLDPDVPAVALADEAKALARECDRRLRRL